MRKLDSDLPLEMIPLVYTTLVLESNLGVSDRKVHFVLLLSVREGFEKKKSKK